MLSLLDLDVAHGIQDGFESSQCRIASSVQRCARGGEEVVCGCRSPWRLCKSPGRRGMVQLGPIQAWETGQAILHQQGEGWLMCSHQLFLYPGDTAQTLIFPAEKKKILSTIICSVVIFVLDALPLMLRKLFGCSECREGIEHSSRLGGGIL